jgi:hypothetical protein
MNKFGLMTAIAVLFGVLLGIMFSSRDFVTAAPNVVNTFNTRTGNVTLTSSDVTGALTFTPANQADLSATNTNLTENYFTKLASDSRFALLGSSYIKTESDAKYAPSGQVVTSLNNLRGGVTLNAGSNVTITPNGNTVTIAANFPPQQQGSPQPYINPKRVATLQWYESNKTGINFPVGGAEPSGIAFDGANLWVINNGSNNVTKIRPRDGATLGIFGVGNQPWNAAFDGASIWITNTGDNTVTRLQASDGANLGTFNVGSGPRGVAFDGSNIWVTNGSSNTVTKLRARDGANQGTFSVGANPVGIAFDGANIWVANSHFSSPSVTKLRAIDGANLGTLTFSIGSPLGIAFDGANIWISTSRNTVTKLRASDGANIGTFVLTTDPCDAREMAFDGVNIWVSDQENDSLFKIRASDGVVLDHFGPASLSPAISFGTPRGIAFDGANVWIAIARQPGYVMKF